MKPEIRVGLGYDIHRLTEEDELILGGVKIPYKYGLKGHSDADVLIHALMDAILGALGKGDIGKHFPDDQSQYKGISSLLLLKRVYEEMKKEKYKVNNIDLVMIAEEPKIAPYISQMKENISEILSIEKDLINIKATTAEGLGFIGKKQGMASKALVTLVSS